MFIACTYCSFSSWILVFWIEQQIWAVAGSFTLTVLRGQTATIGTGNFTKIREKEKKRLHGRGQRGGPEKLFSIAAFPLCGVLAPLTQRRVWQRALSEDLIFLPKQTASLQKKNSSETSTNDFSVPLNNCLAISFLASVCGCTAEFLSLNCDLLLLLSSRVRPLLPVQWWATCRPTTACQADPCLRASFK